MQLREQMKVDLIQAMKVRQSATIATLRSVLAAIDNAEAVAVSTASTLPVEPVLGKRHEVPRKLLSADDIRQIIQNEMDERQANSLKYAALGRKAEAERLQTAAALIASYLRA